jgi:hypothetical protein
MLSIPAELRNRMARLDIEAQGGAGSAILLDERHRRRPVAILGERATAGNQPLLQEIYFLERALDPYVSLSIGDRESVLTRNTAVLLIPDGAAPSANDREGDRQVDRARRHRRALRRPPTWRPAPTTSCRPRCAWATVRWAAS